jgi:hypothetical protein
MKNHPASITTSPAKVQYMLPGALQRHFQCKPLSLGESEEDYDALVAGLIADLQPVSTMESEYVKDLADFRLKIRRLKHYESVAYQGELIPALLDMVKEMNGIVFTINIGSAGEANKHRAKSHHEIVAERLKANPASLPEIVAEYGVDWDELHYRTLKRAMPVLTWISTEIERCERGFEQVLMAMKRWRDSGRGLIVNSQVARQSDKQSDSHASQDFPIQQE